MAKLAVIILFVSFYSIFATNCDPDDLECHEKKKYTRGLLDNNFLNIFLIEKIKEQNEPDQKWGKYLEKIRDALSVYQECESTNCSCYKK